MIKKEVHVKIDGRHTKGTIIGSVYKTNELINSPKSNFSVGNIKSIIKELQELVEIMDSCDVVGKLSEQDDDSDSIF